MKILHIAESIRGGCGTYLNEIVPLQVKALGADRVRVLAPRQHLDQLPDIDPALVWSFDRPSRTRGLPGLARATHRALQAWQPGLVHAHSTFAGAVSRVIGGGPGGASIVYCPHGWVFDVTASAPARKLLMAVERQLARRCARIVAISEAEQQQGLAAGIEADKLVVVPNGVRDHPATPPAAWAMHGSATNEPRLKLLFVGRLDRQKGVDILLDAVRDLGAHCSVHIVGAQVLAGAGLTDTAAATHIEWLGWCSPSSVAQQLQACDVAVMPSRWEGFGLVAIEAMRAGKAVVASAVGGLREIVRDGETGRLVPAGDAAALREALLAHSQADFARMGQAGRERYLAHYTRERTHERLLALYQDVLGPAHAATAQEPGQAAKACATAPAALPTNVPVKP